jgi:hypothetical protein
LLVFLRGGPPSGTPLAVAITRSHRKAHETSATGRTSLLGTTAETAARSNDKTSTSANGKAGEVTTLLARDNPLPRPGHLELSCLPL